MMRTKSLLLASGLLLMSHVAAAASLVDGDAETGKSKAVVCQACHGADGNSSVPLWPSLAGQGAPYIASQLRAFQNDERKDPQMSSQAMLIAADDIDDVAVYFESLPRAAHPVAAVTDNDGNTVPQSQVIARAEALYRGGDLEDKTAACMACHGPSGRGNPAAEYPAIAGQHADYTAKQLRDYRSGTRKTDGKTRVMRDIAATLSDDDIAALSAYIQGLH